jgi:hypothetical protein
MNQMMRRVGGASFPDHAFLDVIAEVLGAFRRRRRPVTARSRR